MIIHFICAGNTYRSRLAEAYFNSLQLPGFEAISSGVIADHNENGPITTYARDIAAEECMSDFMKPHWDQLTQAQIDASDVVVAVNKAVYRAASARFSLPLTTIIWDIPDVQDVIRNDPERLKDHAAVSEVTERTYRRIRAHVDELVTILARLRRPSAAVEVLRVDGTPTGQTSTVTEANRLGLWRAGVHGIIYCPNGQILIQQRSASIIGDPGKWEISLGGGVDAGETPLEAVIREANEELGLKLVTRTIELLAVKRTSHYLPKYGFHSRVLMSSYVIEVPNDSDVRLEQAENQAFAWLTVDELKLALARHATTFVNYPVMHASLIATVEQRLQQQTPSTTK